MINNPFRNSTKRKQFDGIVKNFNEKHRDLFLPDGMRRGPGTYGSSSATNFWKGYDGSMSAPSTYSLAYIIYRAGLQIGRQHRKDGTYLVACQKNRFCTGNAIDHIPKIDRENVQAEIDAGIFRGGKRLTKVDKSQVV